MTVYIAFGNSAVGKDLFLALFQHAESMDLLGHSRDADEAIAETAQQKPDLVIVEEILKYGWGLDVVEQIRARKASPVVFMVSTAEVPHPAHIFQSQGIDLWFQLPQDRDKLDEALEKLSGDNPAAAIAVWRQQIESRSKT